jgi:hypothetical protein
MIVYNAKIKNDVITNIVKTFTNMTYKLGFREPYQCHNCEFTNTHPRNFNRKCSPNSSITSTITVKEHVIYHKPGLKNKKHKTKRLKTNEHNLLEKTKLLIVPL